MAQERQDRPLPTHQGPHAGARTPALQLPTDPQAREHLRHLESTRQDQDNDNTHFRGSFYSTTILDLLIREGGTAKTAKVMRHMEKVLTPLFTPADRAHLDKKGPRWRSKVNDAAHSLRKLGYLTTPTRATWEITPEGRHNLARINY